MTTQSNRKGWETGIQSQENIRTIPLEKRIQWLIDFTRQDLSNISKKKLMSLNKSLKSFSTTARLTDGGWLGPELSINQLKQIQKQLQDCFYSLKIPNGRWRLPEMPSNTISISLARDTDIRGRSIIEKSTDGRFPYTFWLSFADLLEAAGHHVRWCPECGTLFVPNRRQEYCSGRCSQKVRSRRCYALNREKRLEKRHEAYKEEMKKKSGKNVKVKRRRAKST